MKLEQTTRKALRDLGFNDKTLNIIEGIEGNSEHPGYEYLVKILNDFVGRGGQFEQNKSVGSYYQKITDTVAIDSQFFGDEVLENFLVGLLTHEVTHAVSKIDNNVRTSAAAYSKSRQQGEGEALYYEYMALSKLYPETRSTRKDCWLDNEAEKSFPSINFYPIAIEIIKNSKTPQEAMDALGEKNREFIDVVNGIYVIDTVNGAHTVEFTYDEADKWYWLKNYTDFAIDYMAAKGVSYTDKKDAWEDIEANADYLYDIKTLVNRANNYFGVNDEKDAHVDNTLSVKEGGSALGSIKGREILWGGLGNDTLKGSNNTKDILLGGEGDDTLIDGGNHQNELYGGDGNDTIIYTGDNGQIYGDVYSKIKKGEEGAPTAKGNDTIKVEGDFNYISTGVAGSEVGAGEWADYVHVKGDENVIVGGYDFEEDVTQKPAENSKEHWYSYHTTYPPILNELPWEESLSSGSVMDTNFAGHHYLKPWDDFFAIDGNDNTVFSGNGDDFIKIHGEGNAAYAGAGNDVIVVSGSGGKAYGGSGDDALYGSNGSYLYGGHGFDYYIVSDGAFIGESDGDGIVRFWYKVTVPDSYYSYTTNSVFHLEGMIKACHENGGTSEQENWWGLGAGTPNIYVGSLIVNYIGENMYSITYKTSAIQGMPYVGDQTIIIAIGEEYAYYQPKAEDRDKITAGKNFDLAANQGDINIADDERDPISSIEFKDGIHEEDVDVVRIGDDLHITVKNGTTSVKMENFFKEGKNQYQDIAIGFTGGKIWNAGALSDKAVTPGAGDVTNGSSGNDTLYGTAGNDQLHGHAGDDTLYGRTGNDHLYGGSGSDTLYGGDGNDWLEGGAGNDVLLGGNGSDTYYFERGWGADTIDDASSSGDTGKDIIRFGAGIAAEDILLSKNEYNDLIITLKDSSDTVCVYSFFSDMNKHQLKEIHFADGTVWGSGDIRQGILNGTDGNDVIYGYINENNRINGGAGDDLLYGNNGNDVLYGGSGNDKLFGDDGNDWLEGGTGNDELAGGNGSDTYYFERGWGKDIVNNHDAGTNKKDVIRFGEGITASDIEVKRNNNDLYLVHKQTGDEIKISDYFLSGANELNSSYAIDEIQFFDGSVWTWTDIKEKFPNYIFGTSGNEFLMGTDGNDTIYGYDGNDTLNGMAGDDFLVGGAGSDILYGGEGSDIYYYEKGWGRDLIYSGEVAGKTSKDVIRFGEGISWQDIEVTWGIFYTNVYGDLGTLQLRHKTTGDTITIGDAMNNYMSGSANHINEVQFADGTVWDQNKLYDLVSKQYADGTKVVFDTSGDGWLVGSGSKCLLYGGNGNDTYYFENFHINQGSLRATIQNDNKGIGEKDVIQFGAGVDPNKVRFFRYSDDLIISYDRAGSAKDNLSNNCIIVKDYWNIFNENVSYGIDEIRFANGTVWTPEQIERMRESYYGGNDASYLYGSRGDDILYAQPDNAIVYGGVGNDKLYAGNQGSVLSGGTGDDWLQSGTGDDYLYGSYGSDTYFFNQGWGQDVIEERPESKDTLLAGNISNDHDVIRFGDGILASDIALEKQGNNLVISHRRNGDTITVYGHYQANANYAIEKIQFADGVTWDKDKIEAIINGTDVNTIYGTEGKDILNGTVGNDAIYGGGGDDVIQGMDGNDYLDGGDGNDNIIGSGTLIGGDGNDTLNAIGSEGSHIYGGKGDDTIIISDNAWGSGHTFYFNLGDGKDIIYSGSNSPLRYTTDTYKFGEGITADDITFLNNGSEYITMLVGDQGDQIMFGLYGLYFQGTSTVRFEFADGTVWENVDYAFISERFKTGFYGTEDSDEIEGGQGNDRIFGYGGDDFILDAGGYNYLDGGDGDDIIIGTGELVGGKGNDQLCAINSLLPWLIGLEGNAQGDIIRFNLGDGQDVISHDLTLMSGTTEDYHLLNEELLASGMEFAEGKIIFGADVTSDMISCARDGDNLVIKVGNEGDQMTITDYFRGGIYQTLNNLEFADGTTLRVENLLRTRSQTFAASPMMMLEANTYGVDGLISAMAAFDVPAAASQTSLNPQHQQVMAPVLAASL